MVDVIQDWSMVDVIQDWVNHVLCLFHVCAMCLFFFNIFVINDWVGFPLNGILCPVISNPFMGHYNASLIG